MDLVNVDSYDAVLIFSVKIEKWRHSHPSEHRRINNSQLLIFRDSALAPRFSKMEGKKCRKHKSQSERRLRNLASYLF